MILSAREMVREMDGWEPIDVDKMERALKNGDLNSVFFPALELLGRQVVRLMARVDDIEEKMKEKK